MSTSLTLHLQTQVVYIVEALAKSAIAEIRKVIDEGTEVSRMEMSRSNEENETLKRKLLQMEKELEAARKGVKIRAVAGERSRTVKEQAIGEIRGADAPDSGSNKEEQSFSIDSVFWNEWSVGLWKDGELATMKEEEAPPQTVINEEATLTTKDNPGLFSIKVELFEENLEDSEPQGGLKICDGGFESERDSPERQCGEGSDVPPAPAEATRGPRARPDAAGNRLEECSLPSASTGPPVPQQRATRCGTGDARGSFCRGESMADPAEGQGSAEGKPPASAPCGNGLSHSVGFQTPWRARPGRAGPEVGRALFGDELRTGTFVRSADLEAHRVVYRESLFRCDDCGRCYSEKRLLNSHLCSRAGEKPHTCIDCGRGFSREAQLSLHQCPLRREGLYSCTNNMDGSSQVSTFESRHRIYRDGNFYSCAACQRSLTSVKAFDQYLCRRTEQKSHRCFECGKCFTKGSSLNLHLRTIHAGEKPYSCAECGKNFTQKANLKKHQVIHTGEKPYKCLECGKRFTEKGYLKKHHLIHRGVKPYRCRECGRCFYLKSALNSHERTHRMQAT